MFDHLFNQEVDEHPDVTDLRTALLDLLFDHVPIGIAVIDRSLTLLRVNATWRAFLERYAPLTNPQVKTGTKLFDLFPGERRRFVPVMKTAFEGTVIRRDAVSMRRDGVMSYWDVVVTPLWHDEQVWALLIVVSDASDRVFAIRLLEEKEAQYRGIFEATSDGVILHAAGGRIVEANPAACAMYGYSYDEMVGLDSTKLFRSDQFSQALQQVLSGTAVDLRTVNYRKDGSSLNVEVRATLFAYRGEPHMLSVVRDISERVQAYQAAQAAVAAERSRIARDLHDAVTQTLFSASLIAEVLPRLWERDSAEGQRRLAELRQLTRGALAEMRNLLLELRPATLVEAELGDLLRQLSEAFSGRARIPANLRVEGKHLLPPDVQIAFYRVAQEALNNILKHAQATEVNLELCYSPDGACLTIADNGRGFDPDGVTAERFGLEIMRERAESVGAVFELETQSHGGTQIMMRWGGGGLQDE
jgi:PAS domain S-box-containing protein